MSGDKTDTKIVREFDRFARSGYKPALFTKALYRELMQQFRFIAHYDLGGFYEARFGSPGARVETLAVMGVGVLAHTPSKLELSLREWVLQNGLLDRAVEEMRTDTETRERAELARLKSKYESDGVEDPLS